MIAECSNCGHEWIGYAQHDCDFCPRCGYQKIWFLHWGYPSTKPDTRTLIDQFTGKVLLEQEDQGHTELIKVRKWVNL